MRREEESARSLRTTAPGAAGASIGGGGGVWDGGRGISRIVLAGIATGGGVTDAGAGAETTEGAEETDVGLEERSFAAADGVGDATDALVAKEEDEGEEIEMEGVEKEEAAEVSEGLDPDVDALSAEDEPDEL